MAQQVSIVKVLRQKCDDLEDKLDAEVEARDAALAAQTELEEEVDKLKQELEASREGNEKVGETGASEVEGTGGGGESSEQAAEFKAEVKQMQVSLADAQQQKKSIEERIREATASTEALEEEVSNAEAELADERKHLVRVRGNLSVESDRALENTQEAEGQKSERESKLAATRQTLEEKQGELSKIEQERSKFLVSRDEALDRTRVAEEAKRSLEAKLADTEQDMARRESALAEDGDSRLASLQKALAEEQERGIDLQRMQQELEATKLELQEQFNDAKASSKDLQERRNKVEGELRTAEAAGEKIRSLADKADKELAEEQRQEEQLQQECLTLSNDRDTALERMQGAEEEKGTLEIRLNAVEQIWSQRMASLSSSNNENITDLQKALAKEKEVSEQLQITQQELDATRRSLEGQLSEVTSSMAAMQEEVAQVQQAYQDSKAATDASGERMVQANVELKQERERLESAQEECTQLSSERDGALEQAKEIEQAKDSEGQQNTTLIAQLEAEQQARAAKAKKHRELQQLHDEHLLEGDDERQRADALVVELEESRRSRKANADSLRELQDRHCGLVQAREQEQQRIGKLTGALEEERQRHAALDVSQAQCQDRHSELSQMHSEQEQQVAALMEEFETQQQLRATEAQKRYGLHAECEKLAWDLKGHTDAQARSRLELERLREHHSVEKQRADEFYTMLDASQPMHEALAAKYSSAVKQIEHLRNEKEKVTLEKEHLCRSLEEERAEAERARREREEAEPPGPAQLSVSDVLISVTFEGVAVPLQLKPMDTNLEDVVSVWFATVKIKLHLKESVLRYLRHLEETTQVFPVHLEAKLLDVYEEFGM